MYKIRKRLFFTMHITHYFFEICSVDNKKKEEVHEKKKKHPPHGHFIVAAYYYPLFKGGR